MNTYRPHIPHIWKQEHWPQPGDLFSLGRKILREPGYAALWRKTKDISVLEKAGFINDGLLRHEAKELDQSFHQWTTALPPHRACKSTPVVLLTTGSFAPFHEGHAAMVEAAEKFCLEQGWDVVGSYFSPSHDLYVSNKDGGRCGAYPAAWRVDQIREFLRQRPNKTGIDQFVDPWESLIAPRALNFTTVIRHLQQYFEHHWGEKVKVLYVFGADNAAFAQAFDQQDSYAASLCVGRPGSSPPSLGYFTPLDHIGSSTAIRRQAEQETQVLPATGCYFLRNEHSWALSHWEGYVEGDVLEKAWNIFAQSIEMILRQSFDSHPGYEHPQSWQTLDLADQRNWAEHQAEKGALISLDPCLDGLKNITQWPYSRYFSVCDDQSSPLERGVRPAKALPSSLPVQADLIDDDAVSGQSIAYARHELQGKGVDIQNVHLLLEKYAKDVMFDVVDLRDFLLGSKEGGLVIKMGETVTRVPYAFPYVDLEQRARLPRGAFLQSSREIWKASEQFFKALPFDLKVKHMHETSRVSMLQQWGEDVSLKDICQHWKNVLEPRVQPWIKPRKKVSLG